MAQQEYAYYGFISYNRHDRKEAVRLQKMLERYSLLKSLRKENPASPGKTLRRLMIGRLKCEKT